MNILYQQLLGFILYSNPRINCDWVVNTQLSKSSGCSRIHSNINTFCHLYQLNPNMSVTPVSHKAFTMKAVTFATK